MSPCQPGANGIKHEFGEPWEVEDDGNELPHMLVVADRDGYGRVEADETDARRIVACVNFCAGVPTEQLEEIGLGGLRAEIEKRDKLIKAMEEYERRRRRDASQHDQLRYAPKAHIECEEAATSLLTPFESEQGKGANT